MFNSEIEAIESHKEETKASTIGNAKKWYYVENNPVSQAIYDAVDFACETLSLKVPLGIEYSVGRNWMECH